MQNSSSYSWWKRVLLAAIGLSFLAFSFPQKDDMVELKAFLKGRTEAKFRSIDKNHEFDLKPGTRGVVVETKYFPETKNYGVCLNVMNASNLPADQKCVWVYYNIKNPNMNLYATSQDTQLKTELLQKWAQEKTADKNQVVLHRVGGATPPATGMASITVRQMTGVLERVATALVTGKPGQLIEAVQGADSTSPAQEQQIRSIVDAEAALKTAVENINQYNSSAQTVMAVPAPATCTECTVRIESYATCNNQNNYLEDDIARLLSGSSISAAIDGSQKEIIRKACVQRSLDTYPNLRNAFKSCGPNDSTPRNQAAKACVSKNYVDLTANSFNAVAECLGDYVSGNPDTKKEAALAVFSLATLESGLHTNAMSPTGAGGIGQLTQPAIADVNSRLKVIRDHLAKSNNPLCNRVLQDVMKTPMKEGRSQSCDRVGLSKDNPLKNMIYTFAYQGSQRKYLEETALKSRIFSGVISSELSASERERLGSSIAIWSHNTGPGGMKVPLTALMTEYLQARKSIKTAADVDTFLRDLQLALVKYPHSANRARARLLETSTFFGKIQERVARITKEPRQCLAD